MPGPGPYALSHSVGCLPRDARAALESGFMGPWAHKAGGAWEDWLRGMEEFGGALARLFGGLSSEFCPQSNLSSGLAKVLSALPHPPGARGADGISTENAARGRQGTLLAAEDSFPSLGFVLEQARRKGYGVRWIPRTHSPADIQTWARELSADIRAVLVTHVHSNSGEVAPVAQIARLCVERNSLCIVDVAQSAGIVPLSVTDLGAHVVLGSCVKWLCGGPGAGFMWVSSAMTGSLEPTDVGWFSHADPFEFDIHHFEYARDARRFWGGTPTVAPFVVAAASLRIIADIGVPAIHAHNRRLMRDFVDALSPAWRARVTLEGIGGTLCIPVGADLEAITESLSAARVQFDCRGPVVRLSFHVYNTVEDALRIAAAWPR